MVEAERLAEQVIGETIAVQALKCFAVLKEARELNDTTAIKALEPQALYYAEFLTDETVTDKPKGRRKKG